MEKRRRLRRPPKTILRATVGAAAIVLSGCPAFGNLRALDCDQNSSSFDCFDMSMPDDLAAPDMHVDGGAPDLLDRDLGPDGDGGHD